MYIRIKDIGGDGIRKTMEKALGLFDCYSTPPEIDGVLMTKAYLDKQIWLVGGALIELKDDIIGGVYGDVASQLLRVLSGNGLIDDDSKIELNDRELTYGDFKRAASQGYADMMSDVVDDKDQECFKSRKRLLDTFWEGCIEQNNDWMEDD